MSQHQTGCFERQKKSTGPLFVDPLEVRSTCLVISVIPHASKSGDDTSTWKLQLRDCCAWKHKATSTSASVAAPPNNANHRLPITTLLQHDLARILLLLSPTPSRPLPRLRSRWRPTTTTCAPSPPSPTRSRPCLGRAREALSYTTRPT